MREPGEALLPAWVVETLRAPVESAASQRAAIMDRIRTSRPAPLAPDREVRTPWSLRGLLTPSGGMTMVAALLLTVALGSATARHAGLSIETAAVVLGDSVLPVRDDALHDSASGRLLDTMRVVEFVLRGPAVRSADVVGDFNAWRRGATALSRDVGGAWRVRVLVPRDALRFAYVVNEATLISAKPLRPVRAAARWISDSI